MKSKRLLVLLSLVISGIIIVVLLLNRDPIFNIPKNIILILGHAGTENHNALQDTTVLFLRRNSHFKDLTLVLIPVWEFSSTWMKAFKSKDYHAGYIETSLMLYWAPEEVRQKVVLDTPRLVKLMREHPDNYLRITKKVDSEYVIPHLEQRPDIKVGVMGDPSGANAATGKKVADECICGIVKLIKQIESKKL